MASSRGQFSSRIGFIMAAAGSAVGLGNVWGFPTQVANNGGGAFVLVYVVLTFFLAYPVFMNELLIGRYGQANFISSLQKMGRNQWHKRFAFIIGFGAIVMLVNNPEYLDPAKGGILGGNNMAAIHLAKAVGGEMFLGFISAVAFATILAVVSGLTLSGASAISHDLYASVIKHGKVKDGEEVRVSRIATICLGIMAIFQANLRV